MESTMDLPPPAPPDAFSLDDEDSSVPLATHQQQQTATAATAAGLSSSIHASQAEQKQHQQEIATGLGNVTAAAAQQAGSTSPPAASAANEDSMHLGHGMAGATDVPTDQQTQQQSHAGTRDVQTQQQQQSSPTKQSTSPKGTSPRQPATQAPAGDTKDGEAPQEQQQQQQHVPGHPAGHRQQPKDLTGLLSQLSDNAEAIAAAEEVLGGLLARQAALHQLGRKMEQQQVLSVLEQGHLGYNKGRPVAAVLLYRCMHRWGLLQQTEPCPFLEQLASLLQSQLDLDDASAPAEVAGLQCHVANSLTLCAVLYCVLLKASHPELVAAAAAGDKAPKQLHSAADVVAAARKKMSATWQQGVAHMGPGLQALGKLKLGSWGFKRYEDAAAAAPAAAHDDRSGTSTSSQGHAAAAAAAAAANQQESLQASTDASQDTAAAGAAAGSGSRQSAASLSPSSTSTVAGTDTAAVAAVTAERLHPAAPLGAFMLCLDHLIQHAYILLRDQLKRRLTPLLADCISPENNMLALGESAMYDDDAAAAAAAGGGEGGGQTGQPLSPSAAAAAVAGSAAESAAHAEAALMNFRSWSELVGVLHAALVALRAAHVPRALRATLMQQVLEFVNCQLFNQLLLRPECCSVSNARYALRGLKQLDTWIIAEQSAAQHDSAHSGRQSHATVGAGSIHSGSFNSQTPAPAAAAGAAAAAEAPDASAPGQGVGSTAAAAAAAAAAAVTAGRDEDSTAAEGRTVAVAPKGIAEDDDNGWEQVPADTGEFDAWQPPKQQQQHWWRPHKQQAAVGPAEQPELGPEAWNALAHVRQALQFLVFEDKGALSLEDLTEHVCPALNHQQQYRLCTTAWSDAPDTPEEPGSGAGGVSGEVLEQMKQLYTLSSNGGLIVTFLLDEPSGPLPFVQPPPPSAATAVAAAAARCKPSAVVCWDDGRDYGVGLRPVPALLVDEGCPAEVFEFLGTGLAWPPGRHGS